jgi:succinylglutamic semialdehyde dehydrogenase
MRSMVEGDARWLKAIRELSGRPCHHRASHSTTLRVVPLSQEGEESHPWRRSSERTYEPRTVHQRSVVLRSRPALTSIDPATGETVWQAATATASDVEQAVAAARAAFQGWADLPREDRIAAMRRYKAALDARKDAFAEALSRETGKALWETKAELGSMMAKVDVSITAYEERTGVRETAMPFGRAVLRHRAHGVMAVLGPFNFPGHLPNGHIVPALLAGDTIVFKPSEETPMAGELLVEALAAADLPPGVVNLVQGGRETGAALIEQEIDGLLFTGSAAAGSHFRRAFADRPDVILALELGGNNPLVVWDVDRSRGRGRRWSSSRPSSPPASAVRAPAA